MERRRKGSRMLLQSRCRTKQSLGHSGVGPDTPNSGAKLAQADLEPALNERVYQPERQPPEKLRHKQPSRRITPQDRLVRQPLQQRYGAQHPENEPERKP